MALNCHVWIKNPQCLCDRSSWFCYVFRADIFKYWKIAASLYLYTAQHRARWVRLRL